MMNVGIQCCKRNGVSIAVKSREVIRVDPFGSKSLAIIILLYRNHDAILSCDV